MRNIGITQRVHFIKEYNEYRDELDQNWSNLFGKIGILQIILPNNSELIKRGAIDDLNLNGVILSGESLKKTMKIMSASKIEMNLKII